MDDSATRAATKAAAAGRFPKIDPSIPKVGAGIATPIRGDNKAGKANSEQKWQLERDELAAKREAEALTERTRRAGMSVHELAIDDARLAGEMAKEAERVGKLSETERYEEADKKDPLPPWQTRLPSGLIFDAREQGPVVLVAVNGTSILGQDRSVALEFYLAFIADEVGDKKKKRED